MPRMCAEVQLQNTFRNTRIANQNILVACQRKHGADSWLRYCSVSFTRRRDTTEVD